MKTIEETYRERLKLLIAEYGGQTQLAEVLDKKPSQISQWLNGSPDSKTGKPRIFKAETAREIEKATGKPHAWFDQPLELSSVPIGLNNVTEGPEIRTVPLISWVQAGAWSEVVELLQPGEGEWVRTTYKVRPHTYALRVSGDSMEPEFTEGDIIIVEPDRRAENGNFVVVHQDGNTTFKKLVLDGTRAYLKPLNDKYPLMDMGEEAEICGVIVEKLKKYA